MACPNMWWYPQCRETRPCATTASSLWARGEATSSLREIKWQHRTKDQVNKGKAWKTPMLLPKGKWEEGRRDKQSCAELESVFWTFKAKVNDIERQSDLTISYPSCRFCLQWQGCCKSSWVKACLLFIFIIYLIMCAYVCENIIYIYRIFLQS